MSSGKGSLVWLPLVLMMTCLAGHAQTPFPSRAVRLIASSAPGGAVDAVTRVVSTKLNDALGQPVVVENRAGASGAIAAEITAKSPPDGYTVMLGGNANLTLNPLMNKLPYQIGRAHV